jgi:hypothetical protein
VFSFAGLEAIYTMGLIAVLVRVRGRKEIQDTLSFPIGRSYMTIEAWKHERQTPTTAESSAKIMDEVLDKDVG